jgi:hypothetical protein
MTADEFWHHISSTQESDPYLHREQLVERLSRLPVEEILDFDYWWVQARNQAYTATLWAAAALINGGWLSDDRFEYFGGWLILRGRQTFESVIADPDSLAGIVTRDDRQELSFEGYPAQDAWMAAMGTTHEDGGWEAFIAAAEARHGQYFGVPDLDEELWDFEDRHEMRRRLPRLATMFVEHRPP